MKKKKIINLFPDCLRSPKDKRDRRDREAEHRTNHDRIESNRRSSKVCNLPEKRGGSSSNSDDRDRDRERDRERERSDRDRERVTRIGDWSEHVSSSGKTIYFIFVYFNTNLKFIESSEKVLLQL